MGLYSWQNAAGNAALSRHWSVLADNFRTGKESHGPVYAQQRSSVAGGQGDWAIRLDETRLPLISLSARASECPSLVGQYAAIFVPDLKMGPTSRVIEVEGKTLRVWDSPFSSRNIGIPFDAEAWTSAIVRNGRELPVSRMRAFGSHPFFGVAYDFDYTEFTEPIGDHGHRCVLAPYVPLYAMHLNRKDGETTLDGVYMCWRPIIARAVEQEGGVAFDYTAMVLPDYHVFEIGTLAGGETTAGDQVVIDGRGFVVDAGLARQRLGDTAGTHFCCAVISSGISVLQFPHVVTDPDSSVCGTIEPIGVWANATSTYSPQYSISWLMGLMVASPVGECAAFEWSYPDNGKLVHLAHAAGAATTPPFPPHELSFIRNSLPRSDEWGEWANSLYPFTPHVNAVQTLEGPKSIHDELPDLRRKTPIYALRQHPENPGDWPSVEPYPERDVFARTASLQSWARTDCLSPYSSESPTLLRKNEDDAMVICGKRVNSVKIKFEPYEPEEFTALTGVAPVSTDGVPVLFGNISPYDIRFSDWAEEGSNNFRFFWYETAAVAPVNPKNYDAWFEPTQTIDPPADEQNSEPLFPIKRGKATRRAVGHRDAFVGTTVPAGLLPAQLEAQIISTQVCRLNAIGLPGGSTEPSADDCVGDIASLGVAPLTGEYVAERFSVGDVPAAGYLFRFADSGQWEADRAFNYTVRLRTVEVNDEWFVPAPIPAPQNYAVKQVRTEYWSPVAVAERWSLSSDLVEIYCSLSTMLQEAGTFDPDLSFGYEDQRDAIYRDHLVFDQPRGRMANVITYTEGYEPRPALKLVVNARSAMRGTLELDVDTSSIPGNWPWSLSSSESGQVAAKVSGTAGTGNVSGEGQTKSTHHVLRTFEHQFSADDTAALLAGDSVVASTWNQPGGSPNEPHVFDYGGLARRYKVTCTLDLEDVD